MATLVLSTVGTILGGPIGGAIGSLIGQGIDTRLFGPGPKQGPRLGDLSVQTSSYGTPIPRVYGTMRVAGSVIWATDLKESSETQIGGKGQPDAVTYSYTVSLAVALSSRPAISVKRIWADGKLLRGAAGDFKVGCTFRFYDGSEDQPIDPLIGSVEGIADTPAYRGLAVAVFEDLQLAEYGNRIPFLTFEIEGSADATIGAILTDSTGGQIVADDARAVAGYAAYGASIRAAIEPIVDQFGVELFDDGERLAPLDEGAPILLPDDALGSRVDREDTARSEHSQLPAQSLPATLTLNYYDPARDYQAGQAKASVGRADGLNEDADIAVVLDAAAARGLAETSLARRWARRERLTLRLPPEFIDLKPGALVTVADVIGVWRAEQITIEGLVVIAELRAAPEWAGALPSDPGRHSPEPDVVIAATQIALFELPDLGLQRPLAPMLHLAAANASPGWRMLPVEVAAGGVVSAGHTARRESVLGLAVDALGLGQAFLFDEVNSLTVELVDDDHWLESRDDDALANGANLAVLGDELLQFGIAEPLGSKRFRLTRMLRGRRGTEWAMAGHAIGDAFALLDPTSIQAIALTPAAVGTSASVTARGIADGSGVAVSKAVTGEALRPPSPVHLRADILPDGTLAVSWVRRSRDGFLWLDAVDAPLGESVERYRLTVQGAASSIERDVATGAVSLTAAEVTPLGSGAATISVVQIGDFAASRSAVVTIIL